MLVSPMARTIAWENGEDTDTELLRHSTSRVLLDFENDLGNDFGKHRSEKDAWVFVGTYLRELKVKVLLDPETWTERTREVTISVVTDDRQRTGKVVWVSIFESPMWVYLTTSLVASW
jgi:hypothetical protein